MSRINEPLKARPAIRRAPIPSEGRGGSRREGPLLATSLFGGRVEVEYKLTDGNLVPQPIADTEAASRRDKAIIQGRWAERRAQPTRQWE